MNLTTDMTLVRKQENFLVSHMMIIFMIMLTLKKRKLLDQAQLQAELGYIYPVPIDVNKLREADHRTFIKSRCFPPVPIPFASQVTDREEEQVHDKDRSSSSPPL